MCLHIALPTLSMPEDDSQAMNCIQPLLESCLRDMEGTSFFCDDDIFIICRNVSYSVLQEIVRNVCDLVLDGNISSENCKIFDLAHDGQGFVDYYCKQGKRFTLVPLPHPSKDKKSSTVEALFTPMEEQVSQNPDHKDSIKVLLVEDDPVTRWMVRNSLRATCQFATAQDGNKAISLYNSYHPDIVFLDINMPGKDGRSVLRWIMTHDPGAYVVMFSSEGHLDTIVDTLEDGAKGFITKPFRKDQLVHYLDSCPSVH